MKDAKDILISINDRNISFEIGIRENDLIEKIFDSISEYVAEGTTLKVQQTYMNSPFGFD